MRHSKARDELPQKSQRLMPIERLAPDAPRQRFPAKEFHRQDDGFRPVGNPNSMNVMHTAEIGVLKTRRKLNFLLEARHVRGLAGVLAAERLQSHHFAAFPVESGVNLAHSSGPEEVPDFEPVLQHLARLVD